MPAYNFSTSESQKQTVAALIGSEAARKARYNSLPDEEKFVYNLSPDDRAKFEKPWRILG